MDPKHLIMGTAGHVDHGKTALVLALTGIDCDTHREEKTRGITINLGFAHFALPGGDTVGIVDVPGHKDFVHTMVSGATGVDIALFVIAADEGIMPQTREHLSIMRVLGVKRGLVALTKTDLVDQEIMQIVNEEIGELVLGTFLEGAPVIGVSSRTGEGIDTLKQEIEKVALSSDTRSSGEAFRLFVDRIFTVKGFGTVVTGSVLSGTLEKEGRVYLLPKGRELRVRRVERHGRQVDSVTAGDRASLNLVGLERSEFERGMVIADRPLRSTTMIDARLQLFDHVSNLGLWSQVSFLVGTYEAQARVHLINEDRIRGGEDALVQVHLPHACVVQCNDRFVIRSSSSDRTLGGGEVIDAFPLHHRRRPPDLVSNMERIAEGKLPELVALEIRKHAGAVGTAAIADSLNVSAAQVDEVLAGDVPSDIRVLRAGDTSLGITSVRHEQLVAGVLRRITAFHKANPLQKGGLTVEELASSLGVGTDAERYVRLLLAEQQSAGVLKPVSHTWALASHSVTLTPLLQQQVEFVGSFLKGSGMQAPLMSELEREAGKKGVDPKSLVKILRHLVRDGSVYESEGSYLHAAMVDPCRERLLRALSAHPAGLSVAQFRDLVSGNRKICLLMYSLFDAEGVTQRQGDVRVITEKGLSIVGR